MHEPVHRHSLARLLRCAREPPSEQQIETALRRRAQYRPDDLDEAWERLRGAGWFLRSDDLLNRVSQLQVDGARSFEARSTGFLPGELRTAVR